MEKHNIDPVFDENSEILILGSFPSVKSRGDGFFYAHPANRFWRVLAECFSCALPATKEEKISLLLDNHIALWDVIKSCEVEGSSDLSIKNAVPNDITQILVSAQIKLIITNGKTAEKYYNKLIYPETNICSVCLPSTSPANASLKTDELVEIWKKSLFYS